MKTATEAKHNIYVISIIKQSIALHQLRNAKQKTAPKRDIVASTQEGQTEDGYQGEA